MCPSIVDGDHGIQGVAVITCCNLWWDVCNLGPTSLDTIAQRDNTELLVTVNTTGILEHSILRCQNIEDSVLSVETYIYMKVGIINYNQIYIYDMQM